jgi:hypothetical protein
MAEVAVALIVLISVGVATNGRLHPSTPAPAPESTALSAWWQNAVPVYTNLTGDLTAIEQDTSNTLSAAAAALASDAARLGQDLARAHQLPAPPDQAAASWNQVLAQFVTPQRTLAAAAATLSPATILLAHDQFAMAGNALVQLGDELRPASG